LPTITLKRSTKKLRNVVHQNAKRRIILKVKKKGEKLQQDKNFAMKSRTGHLVWVQKFHML
jgi:hypothetical protein